MVLALENLTLMCGDRAVLQGVNLDIKSGQTSILFGTSGSGKSLSVLALQGMIPSNMTQTSGAVLLDNTQINPKDSRARVFASILQNPRTCFNPLFSLRTHIQESAKALQTHWDMLTIESMLNEVGLQKEVLKFYPFEMSGGMLQRAMIALALLTKAPFLIADEPTTDLDLVVQYKILTLLKKLQKSYNLGILLITHDRYVATLMGGNCGDTLFCIQDGIIQERIEIFPTITPEHAKSKAAKQLIAYFLQQHSHTRHTQGIE